MNVSLVFLFLLQFMLRPQTAEAQCTNPITDCLTCNANNKCLSCQNSLVPSSDGTSCENCGSYITNCSQCNTDTSSGASACQACSTGLAVSKDKASCVLCTSLDAACTQCGNDANGNPVCLMCSNANKNTAVNLAQTGCTSCLTVIPNCQTCIGDGSQCLTCSSGGSGVLGYIIEPTAQKSCLQCLSNGTLQNNLGCIECDGVSGCLSTGCMTTYRFNNSTNKCDKCISNCDNCTSNLTSCDVCSAGYQWNNAASTCVSVIPNCMQTGGSYPDWTCLQCQQNYGIRNNDNSRCVLCILNDCGECILDLKNTMTCLSCNSGYYWNGAQCTPCSLNLPACLSCSLISNQPVCSQCDSTQNKFLSNGKCLSCGDLNTGCTQCSFSGSIFQCTSCSDGYYIDQTSKNAMNCGIASCLTCSSATTCTSCMSGYSVGANGNCVTCATTDCAVCDTTGTTCFSCINTFYYDGTACQTCNSISTGLMNCESCLGSLGSMSCNSCSPSFNLDANNVNCTSCNNTLPNCIDCNPLSSPLCNACQSGYYANLQNEDLTSVSSTSNPLVSCVLACQANQTFITINTFKKCVSCGLLFGTDCTYCNSTSCLQCVEGSYLLLPLQNSCDPCDISNVDIINQTDSTCRYSPSPNVLSFFYQTDLMPTFILNCGVKSSVYYAYGLHNHVNDFTLKDITSITGMNTDIIVPTNDSINWSSYGIGYGSFASQNTQITFTITSPLKNSGENYNLLAYCVSFNGALSNSTVYTWTQTSNGAQTAVIQILSSSVMDNTKKVLVCSALKQALGLNRDFYTEDGVLCPKYSQSRRILYHTTRKLQNVSNTTNSSTTSGYSVLFYVNPDYTLTFDNLNLIINSSVSNGPGLLSNITSLLSSNYGLTGIQFEGVIMGQDIPIFANTTPKLFPTNSSITLVLTIYTDGILYVGIEKTLNTTSRLLQNSASTTVNESNSSIVPSSTVPHNLTMPNWKQLVEALDCNGNPLIELKTINVEGNSNITVEFTTNLTINTTYNVYFGASNLVFPRAYSNIFGGYATTSLNQNNIQNQSTYSERILCMFWGFFVIIGVKALMIF